MVLVGSISNWDQCLIPRVVVLWLEGLTSCQKKKELFSERSNPLCRYQYCGSWPRANQAWPYLTWSALVVHAIAYCHILITTRRHAIGKSSDNCTLNRSFSFSHFKSMQKNYLLTKANVKVQNHLPYFLSCFLIPFLVFFSPVLCYWSELKSRSKII